MHDAGEEKMLQYNRLEKLGEGTYGAVWKVCEKVTGTIYAMKIMPLDQEEDGIPQTTLRESSILTKIHHPNVMPVKEFFFLKTSFVMICKFMPFDLRKLVRKGPLKPDLVQSYAFQLLQGLYYLHTHRIIHRDIKPENILLDRQGGLELCDFGLSRYFSLPLRQYSAGVITIWYRPPELLLSNPVYDVAVDIWSAGCVIAEMTSGFPLFIGDSQLDMIHKIMQILGTPPDDILMQFHDFENHTVEPPRHPPKDLCQVLKTDNLELVDLISKMLSFSPVNRITAEEALRHPYFNSIRDNIHFVYQKP